MLPQGKSLVPPVLITLFIHLAGSAPANVTRVNRQDVKSNSVFNPSRYSSIPGWSSAQDLALEISNNATKECLSRFSVKEDSSVCFGDDKWEWNAVAVICVLAVLGCVSVTVWLCCDWVLTSIPLFLDDVKDEVLFPEEKPSPSESEVGGDHVEPEVSEARVDPVHPQDADKSSEAKMKNAEEGASLMHPRTAVRSRSTEENQIALPPSADYEAMSAPSRSQ